MLQTFGTVEFTVKIQVTGVVGGKKQKDGLKKIFERTLNSVQLDLARNPDNILQIDASLEVKDDEILEFGYN